MPPGAVVAFRVILAPDINVMTYLLTYLLFVAYHTTANIGANSNYGVKFWTEIQCNMNDLACVRFQATGDS